MACLGLFFVQLDLTVVNVALRAIGTDLGGGRAALQWVVDAYALALASLMLSAGDTADRRRQPARSPRSAPASHPRSTTPRARRVVQSESR